MPKSTPPRKKRPTSLQHTMPSTKGAWDQLHEMIAGCDQLMAVSSASVRLLAEREKLETDVPFNKERALQLANLLLKDSMAFKTELDQLRGRVGVNRGDISEDDVEALMLTLQTGQHLSDWTERWSTIVTPTIEEINELIKGV